MPLCCDTLKNNHAHKHFASIVIIFNLALCFQIKYTKEKRKKKKFASLGEGRRDRPIAVTKSKSGIGFTTVCSLSE